MFDSGVSLVLVPCKGVTSHLISTVPEIEKYIEPHMNVFENEWNSPYKIEKDYNMMKKYYLMAIEKGHSSAMNCLGLYYFQIENDYENAKKYILIPSKNLLAIKVTND